MSKQLKSMAGVLSLVALTACGTAYHLPVPIESHRQEASRLFAEVQAEQRRTFLSPAAAEQRYRRVAARILPVAKTYCEALTAEKKNVNCEVDVAIERELDYPNAFLIQGKHVETEETLSFIRITVPMLQQTTSDDEVAFILSHEYGHLIARHPDKRKTQATAGAVVGVLLGGDPRVTSEIGYYSNAEEFELEGDALATRITHAAGYDPVKGAEFFARTGDQKNDPGFWITHPPNSDRLATVLATMSEIEKGQAAKVKKF